MSRDLVADCRRIAAPTLLITGEPALDRVVPVSSSVEYLDLIPGTRHVVLRRTGHIGLVSKPKEFADAVAAFLATARSSTTM
jgi:pimeloyl-ACP methyl ester carboxylesterase